MKISKKGFTLIELIAVIVVIAIIALVAFPVFNGIILNSRKDAFLSSALNTLGAAEKAYLANTYTNAGTAGCKLSVGTGAVELASYNLGGVLIDQTLSYVKITDDGSGNFKYYAYLISEDKKTMINGMDKDELSQAGADRRKNAKLIYKSESNQTLTAAPATSCA